MCNRSLLSAYLSWGNVARALANARRARQTAERRRSALAEPHAQRAYWVMVPIPLLRRPPQDPAMTTAPLSTTAHDACLAAPARELAEAARAFRGAAHQPPEAADFALAFTDLEGALDDLAPGAELAAYALIEGTRPAGAPTTGAAPPAARSLSWRLHALRSRLHAARDVCAEGQSRLRRRLNGVRAGRRQPPVRGSAARVRRVKASPRSPDDENVALCAVYDLRADGPEQQALKWIQSAATDDDQVSVLRRFDDDVAGVALRLDRLGIDPARGQQLLCLVEIVASSLDLGWIEVGSLCDASARQRLGGRDHDHTS